MRIEQIASKRGYMVTEDGKLINPYGKSIGSVDSDGYIKTTIRVNKLSKKLKAHRLQSFQKYGMKLFDEGVIVRHFDGNPLNNSWENILIGTQSDNMMDIPEQIRIKRSLRATSFVRKYNKSDVIEFHELNKSYKETMEKFNISSKGTLWFILNK